MRADNWLPFVFGTDWSSHKYKLTYHIVLLHQKKNCKWFFHLVWLFFAGEIITATFIGSEIITHKFRRWLYHTRWNNSCEKHLVWFFVWKKSRVILVCHTRWKGEIITRDKWLSCELRFFFVCHTRWKKSRLTRESFISCELRIFSSRDIFFKSWYFLSSRVISTHKRVINLVWLFHLRYVHTWLLHTLMSQIWMENHIGLFHQ